VITRTTAISEGERVSAVDDFLRKILRSGLLDREHLQSTLRTLP
jgi:hypothetical protein